MLDNPADKGCWRRSPQLRDRGHSHHISKSNTQQYPQRVLPDSNQWKSQFEAVGCIDTKADRPDLGVPEKLEEPGSCKSTPKLHCLSDRDNRDSIPHIYSLSLTKGIRNKGIHRRKSNSDAITLIMRIELRQRAKQAELHPRCCS